MPQISHEDLFGSVDLSTITPDIFVPDASSGDGIIRTHEQCCEWARKLACTCKYAEPDELFIDIDTDRQFALFDAQVKLLKKHFWFKSVTTTPSKQGLPHRHIVVKMARAYDLMTRIALQACLGSDPMRELLSAKRAHEGEDNVVIFFEKEQNA
jgi:hypothetical protein